MPSESNVLRHKNDAIVKIVLCTGVLLFNAYLLSAAGMFEFGCTGKLGREGAAIQTLRTIHEAQACFFNTHKRFGSLQELFDAKLLPINLSSQSPVAGYTFTDSGISESSYCVHATRASQAKAYRDFNITEEAIIRANTARQPALLLRGEGVSISQSPPPE